jgi:hypothetical protein
MYVYVYMPVAPQASCPRLVDIDGAVPGVESLTAVGGVIKVAYAAELSEYRKGTLDDAMAESGHETLPDDPLGAADKKSVINARTRELILTGFEYPPASGQVFSLSDTAQRNLSELDGLRAGLTYPFDMATIDDLIIYSVVDADAVHAMYLAGLARIQWAYGTGNAMKATVIAATTREEVAAVVDNR